MPLLTPLFLLGLAAIAVPLLVHLVQREKHDPVAFPSLMFLERTKAPYTARRHLRNPWLFLLRALAVAALVLAFARPVFGRRTTAGVVDARRREFVVLVDRSFSMRINRRWDRARSSVDSVIRTLSPRDHMTLVAFDRRAVAVTSATSDREVLRAALSSLSPTDESTRLAPAIAVAQQRLASSDAPRKVLVVVSDLQRTGWDLSDDARLPAGTEVAVLDVNGESAIVDRAVRSVAIQRVARSGPAQVIVSARVANIGAAARAIGARLEVGGRTIEERTLDLLRDGGATVTFSAVAMPPNATAARVVLSADSLPGDDAFSFILQPAPVLPVLVIETRASPFLSRALTIGDSPRFEVTSKSPARAGVADLAGRRLVILADGAFPTGIGAARLMQFVMGGGGIVIALGDETLPSVWPASARGLIPGQIRAVTDRADGAGAVLGTLDQQHPALASLSGPNSGDLASARFYKYRGIDTTAGVLARFDDGSAALTEHMVGRGHIVTFGSSLDGAWNDLPRQPAFLPLMQQLARYAAGWRDAPRSLGIGASVRPTDIADAHSLPTERWIAIAPSGARTSVGGSGAPAALELTEAGVHELRPGGSPGARPLLVAANIAPQELELASFDALRLTTALASAVSTADTTTVRDAEETAVDREARQSTWWYLLLAATLLLVAESVAARRAMIHAPTAE